jgi:hypothetical protein
MEPSWDSAGCSNVNSFVPPRQFDPNILEMMDRPDADPRMLRDDLKNLRIINRLSWWALCHPQKHSSVHQWQR